jgi:hypothetical protein
MARKGKAPWFWATPKKETRGVRRQLRRVKRQNVNEYDKQRAVVHG